MADNQTMQGLRVVVVGGTTGINVGIAEGFARKGARVVVVSRSQANVDKAVARLRDCGSDAHGFTADVRDAEAIETVFAAVADRFECIDVLVSGAAGNFPARALDMSSKGFKTVVDIDLFGTYHVLRSAHPYLVKPGASVINVSAPQSFVPMELQSHVCAAKAGVDMVTRVLAMEWGGEGIRVNSVVPGPIEGTEGVKRLVPTAELRELVRESVPLKRLGTAEDVAQVVMFLASTAAAYVSGAVIPVDGGWSLGGVSVSGAALNRYASQLG